MQTVMTALIERIKNEYNDCGSNALRLAYSAILLDAEEMIKQEREQIEDAYFEGECDLYENSTDYYTQTYGK